MKASYKHPWTCKIMLEYHACPKCGYIIECRDDYKEREEKFIKELSCPRCHCTFIEEKKSKGVPTPY